MISKYIHDSNVQIFENRKELGERAANDIVRKIEDLLKTKSELRIIFAAAPSQNEMLAFLLKSVGVDWSKIVAFHMDEYVGLPEGAPQSFATFLQDRLFSKLSFKSVNLINGNSPDNECERYSRLISQAPIDIICMGIGENGHIAFNDPPVADFNDPAIMKKVKLDQVCRQQQVNDGCFSSIGQVPEYAYTLTIPTLMSAGHLFCVVPGKTKQEAVYQTLFYPEISTMWPSTILRKHKHCNFYFDKDSYKEK